MNTGYTVWVYSRPSTRMSRQPFVWHDIVITLHSLAEVYRILVTLTPQRPLQEVWLLLVDHPSRQVFITCQGHRGETCRLNQPGEKLYKYLNIAVKTFLGFTVKCSSSPTNSWSYTRVCIILLMSGVTMTSASQILESFWNIWSQVSQRKKPFSDFPACGPGMYTLSWGIHEVAVAVCWPGKLKSMMAVIE